MLETGGRQLLATSRLEATSTATALPAGAVGGYRGHVLDAANLEAGAGQRAQGGLPARAGALGLVATRSAHLDVKRGQTQLLLCREGGQKIEGCERDLSETIDANDSGNLGVFARLEMVRAAVPRIL